MSLAHRLHFVPGLKADDHTAASESDSINMGLVETAVCAIQFGDMSVASPEIKVYSGASAGTKTTALTFRYLLSPQPAKTAGADVWANAFSTSADLTITFDTDDDKLLLIEVTSAEMTEGEPWLTVEVDNDATVQEHAMIWVCESRYYHQTSVIGA